MNAFLWTMVAILSIEVLSKLYWLALGDIPDRTPDMVAFEVIACVMLLIWIVCLLK